MLYETLRAAARVALRWYYCDVVVQGLDRIPAHGPLLIIANHPNALVDAMLVATIVRRRILITAKATLFEHPLLGPFLTAVGVVPLQRAHDVRAAGRRVASLSRNDVTLNRVNDALRRNAVVLVFPEGISHDESTLAPLKTGAARIALQAHETGMRSLQVLPIGLVFEQKERPRSRVLVRIGDPIDLDAWCVAHPGDNAAALTRHIDVALRRVTLNFANAERAQRAVRLAGALAALADDPLTLSRPRTFESEAEIAVRIETAIEALERASSELGEVADHFISRLQILESRLAARGATLEHAKISLQLHDGARFLVREGALVIISAPLAILGRMTHWLPIHVARTVAMRSLRGDPSRDQPAMRTMVLGFGAVLLWYAVQAALITHWMGGAAAVIWIVLVFAAANLDLHFRDRTLRAQRRAGTYFALRLDSSFRDSVRNEIDVLLAAALALERALLSAVSETRS